MKISVITVTLNADNFLDDCIRSVDKQAYDNFEYIIIDGISSDSTHDIVVEHSDKITHFISEKDDNQYDALNKGISMSSGDVIGILNSDDYFPSGDVLSKIAEAFETTGADIVYGSLDYVNRENTSKIIRKWRSKPYNPALIEWGWMPPHPTFYAKRELFEKYGAYNPKYGTSADYELMIRFMHGHDVKAVCLDEVIVKMRTGGVSNGSLKNRVKASYTDFLAMKDNGLRFPPLAILLKPILKIPQFIR